jgi:hypothetical protein
VPDPVFDVRVDPTIHAQHPDYVALVLVATGLVNGPSEDGSDAQLAGAEAHVRSSGLDKATDQPHIAVAAGGALTLTDSHATEEPELA